MYDWMTLVLQAYQQQYVPNQGQQAQAWQPPSQVKSCSYQYIEMHP